MAFQSFVTEAYLKSVAPISQNIDIAEIMPHLEATELIWTRELLGRPLYDDIKAKFIAQTLNSNEIELVGYIKYHVAYRATSEAIPFLSVKIKAKGTIQLTGDYEQPAPLKQVQWLQQSLIDKAEYFETRVVEYLCRNSELFPLYRDADTKTGIMQNNQPYDSEIIFTDFNDELRRNRYFYGE